MLGRIRGNWMHAVFLVGAFGAAALTAVSHATANFNVGRPDYVGRFTQGTAAVSLEGIDAKVLQVSEGLIAITSIDGNCVPSLTPAQACRFAINSIHFRLRDFEIGGVQVNRLDIQSWEATPAQSTLSGVLSVPEGMRFNASATVDGTASAFPVRTAGAAITLRPDTDHLSIVGSFNAKIDGRNLDLAILATANVPLANHPPIANAGADQDLEAHCTASVRLDSSRTSDPDNNFSHAFFSESGIPVGRHDVPIPFLPGSHVLTLSAFDRLGARSTDDVVVSVRALPIAPSPGAVFSEVQVPAGLRPEDAILLARGQLDLGPNVLIDPSVNRGAIVNTGVNGTTIGVSSKTRDVWSRGPLVVHTDAVVDGSARTQAPITLKNRATVTGTTSKQAVFDPLRSAGWNAVPGTVQQGIFVPPGGSAVASPGHYASIDLGPRAALVLEPGVYFSDSLSIAPGAHVSLVRPGPLQIYVASGLDYRGPIVVGSAKDFLLSYAGASRVSLDERFTGTLFAPHATVVLAKTDAPHVGAWFGASIEVRPDVVLQHEPFDWAILQEGQNACAVTPKVTCVDRSSGSPVVRFGYSSVLTYAGVTVPLGLFNRIDPAPQLRGQPSSFRPGAHEGVFEVPFDGSPISWIVGSRSATANSGVPSCP